MEENERKKEEKGKSGREMKETKGMHGGGFGIKVGQKHQERARREKIGRNIWRSR